MNQVLILAGSNLDEVNHLKLAQQKLIQNFKLLKSSQAVYTQAVGSQYQNRFLDQVFLIETVLEQAALISKLKTIEMELGRNPQQKEQGLISIDLYVLAWNGAWIDQELLQDELIPAIVKEVVSLQN